MTLSDDMQLTLVKKLFKNKDLFDQALTHKSWANENPNSRESYERLEFLGDTILQFVITDYLYKNLTDKNEGYLTALRANIVNTKNLASFAREIKIGESIYFSKGEAAKGRDNSALLADTIEALIGAYYLDQGLEKVRKFILENLLSDLEEKLNSPLKDAKSNLQESLQAKGGRSLIPEYKVSNITGPDHEREFTVQVFVSGKMYGQGSGKSKSEAEQKAAEVALARLTG